MKNATVFNRSTILVLLLALTGIGGSAASAAAGPDLTASITDGLATINTGPNTTMMYTVTISNVGTANSTGIIATVTLPAHTSVVANSISNGGTANGTQIVWPAFALTSGGSNTMRQFTLKLDDPLVPGTPNTITTAVSVDDDHTNGADLNPGNNSASYIDTIVGIPPTTVDIAVRQANGVTQCIPPGQLVTYVLTICNLCTTLSTGIIVSDVIPVGTDYISSSDSGVYNPATRTITWPAFSLASGTSTLRSFTVRIQNPPPAGQTQITNNATVTDDGTHGLDSNPANNSTSLTNDICPLPDLAITKSVPVPCASLGASLTYTLAAATLNATGVTGVVVTDTLPSNTTFVSASDGGTFANGVVTFPAFSLAGNSTALRTITVNVAATVPAGVTNLTNVASVLDDGSNGVDANPNNNTFILTTPICIPVDLSITKSVPVPCASLGSNLTYTLTANTLNATAASGVVITDTLPANTTFVSASDNGVFAKGVVTFPAFSMPGNSTALRTITVAVAASVPAGVTNLANVVTITDDGTHGPDSNPKNNTFTLTTPICSAPLVVAPNLVMSMSQTQVCNNQTVTMTWTMKVSNATGAADSGLVMTDTVPANAAFVSASDGGTYNPATNLVTWPSFNLPAITTVLRSVVMTVNLPLVPPAVPISVTNSASVKDDGSNGPDSNLADNSATVTTQLSNLHFLSDPSANPNPAEVGVLETYTASAQDDANPNVPITYTWNFGDGTTGSGASTTHTYTNAGPFTITLTVSNGVGCPLGFSFNRDTAGTSNATVTCKLLKAQMDLVKPNNDTLNLVAQLSLPTGFNPLGHTLTLDLAGFTTTGTLNTKGVAQGMPKNQSMVLRVNGALSILTVKVSKSSLKPLLAPNVPNTAATATLPNQLFVIAFDLSKAGQADTFGGALDMHWVGNGKRGSIGF